MIGTTFSNPRDAGTYRIVGADGPFWITERLDEFEPPERLTAADLAARFDVAAEAPAQPSAEDGWRALADSNDRAALRLARGDVDRPPTPEEVFKAAEE